MLDIDNDGWRDLVVAQSHVIDNVEQIDPSLHYRELPLIALNHAGRFERTESGLTQPIAARGAAFGDLNGDGWTDVFMTTLGGQPIVFRNHGSAQWLTITLHGTRSNRDGFGAIVTVNGQTQYAQSAASYQSASDKRVHFGLSDASKADIEIDWPSAIRQIPRNVPADHFMAIIEQEQR